MKIYVSGRAKTRLADVKQIQRRLTKMGHQVISDWTAADVKRPYRDPVNREHNIEVQAEMLRKAAKADIFIMLDEPGLRGAYIELGAFLTDCLKNSSGRQAYIVGPDSHEREFIFESPQYVFFCDGIEEVYAAINRI
ncbi:MAG TPA: hypothetical protein VFJ84_02200 [Candidatus Saccharimonadales bacterium]|nr:hypothetical protein [Candidatus Saccharimonadales bacterium]